MTTKRNMCKIKGMSEAKVEKIKEVAAKIQVSGYVCLPIPLFFLVGLWIYYSDRGCHQTPISFQGHHRKYRSG
jgi:hypothetical protein